MRKQKVRCDKCNKKVTLPWFIVAFNDEHTAGSLVLKEKSDDLLGELMADSLDACSWKCALGLLEDKLK